MRVITLFSLVLLMTSCGVKKNSKHAQYLEGTKQYAVSASVFDSYIKKFEEEAAKNLGEENFKVGDIPINFGDTTNEEYDGVCNTYSDGTKEIFIKKSWWQSTDSRQKEIMIFHELGHCRLGRDHDTEKRAKGTHTYKLSIMNPVIPSSADYVSQKNAYLTELFLYDKSPLISGFGI
ncbi:hypothetical protein BMS_1100 [Halobacteriovorax marinus SJ]|uniref:Uncharacterized protein n=1 Tax=Halobacteriovorax marinus (strain ATCC BAA-682 / DSM 15412 / SJ) TaxID=862908 RepID=E1WYD3_HALMS|nr:putative metallopeptidase [Halobacteriovorax marinus]CBW25981.1 hypothetical protein BMS_1100 [Halobacteriovorax marinus SJ]